VPNIKIQKTGSVDVGYAKTFGPLLILAFTQQEWQPPVLSKHRQSESTTRKGICSQRADGQL